MDSLVVILGYVILGFTSLALETSWYFTACKRLTLTKELKLAQKKEMDREKSRRISVRRDG